tara:strand:- start:92 stop:391 length:300 start_codon:yes stop_codon:yes gene_type:complete
MKYFFDLDNTLCITKGLNYHESKPLINRIEKVNELYKKGNKITIYTARGSVSKKNYKDLTESQLKRWGVLYHDLNIGEKPDYDILIDDKAKSDTEFFDK